jgi:hypothetical protein
LVFHGSIDLPRDHLLEFNILSNCKTNDTYILPKKTVTTKKKEMWNPFVANPDFIAYLQTLQTPHQLPTTKNP